MLLSGVVFSSLRLVDAKLVFFRSGNENVCRLLFGRGEKNLKIENKMDESRYYIAGEKVGYGKTERLYTFCIIKRAAIEFSPTFIPAT